MGDIKKVISDRIGQSKESIRDQLLHYRKEQRRTEVASRTHCGGCGRELKTLPVAEYCGEIFCFTCVEGWLNGHK